VSLAYLRLGPHDRFAILGRVAAFAQIPWLMMSISGAQLKAARELIGLSPLALAVQSQLGQREIVEFEAGRRGLPAKTLLALRRALEAAGVVFRDGKALRSMGARAEGILSASAERAISHRSTIIAQIQAVAAEQKKTLAPLSEGMQLLDCGLDSLCFAILLMRLEDEIGLNPFCVDGAILPNTIGELIAFYDTAVAISGAPETRQSRLLSTPLTARS
jgi:transcriptional regulator with XRE-family HTH domain